MYGCSTSSACLACSLSSSLVCKKEDDGWSSGIAGRYRLLDPSNRQHPMFPMADRDHVMVNMRGGPSRTRMMEKMIAWTGLWFQLTTV